jgi:hypothetical protein
MPMENQFIETVKGLLETREQIIKYFWKYTDIKKANIELINAEFRHTTEAIIEKIEKDREIQEVKETEREYRRLIRIMKAQNAELKNKLSEVYIH